MEALACANAAANVRSDSSFTGVAERCGSSGSPAVVGRGPYCRSVRLTGPDPVFMGHPAALNSSIASSGRITALIGPAVT